MGLFAATKLRLLQLWFIFGRSASSGPGGQVSGVDGGKEEVEDSKFTHAQALIIPSSHTLGSIELLIRQCS